MHVRRTSGRSLSTRFRGRSAASRGFIASRLNSAQPALDGYELDAIAAVVIGLAERRPRHHSRHHHRRADHQRPHQRNGSPVAQEWQTVVTGVIIILAVYADILRRKG